MNTPLIIRATCSKLRHIRCLSQLGKRTASSSILLKKHQPYLRNTSLKLKEMNAAVRLRSGIGVGPTADLSKATVPITKASEGINMRLANENDYLSWNRNGYLCTVIGISMTVHESVPYSETAGVVFFGLGFANILLGTSVYQFNLFRYRKEMLMSPLLSMTHSLFGISHVLLWVVGIMIYLYRDDEDEKEDDVDPHTLSIGSNREEGSNARE